MILVRLTWPKCYLVRSSEREVEHLLDSTHDMLRHNATLMAIGKSSFGSDIGLVISRASVGVAIYPVASNNRKQMLQERADTCAWTFVLPIR